MAHRITHFEIIGKDSQKLQDFYGKLFDWKIKAEEMGGGVYRMIETGEFPNGGIADPMDGKSMVTVYIGVDDLEATLKQVESLGGKITMPPHEVPGVVTFAQFQDPSGNIIGLTKNM
jgi:predicted enzyme related to lactoylglutathione lyase